jgi:hypothetical protein
MKPRTLDLKRVDKIAAEIEAEEALYLGYRQYGHPAEFDDPAYWQEWRAKVDAMYVEMRKACDTASAGMPWEGLTGVDRLTTIAANTRPA